MNASLHIAHKIPPLSTLQLQSSRFPSSFGFQHCKLPFDVSSTAFTCRASRSRVVSRQRNRTREVQHRRGGGYDDDGIPVDDVKTLTRFNSEHNCIRVLEVSRKIDHHFAGSRLLLLDTPGNIHSVSFLLKTLTDTYFDVFATLPPILPPGPIAILGFGAGSAARIILELYPGTEIHGWELDPSVVSVGREYFGLSELEERNRGNLFVYIGNALEASLDEGFSGILVDLFSKGSLLPELQDSSTWEKLKGGLRKGGRIMVNCGGKCVEAEDPERDGNLVKEQTLMEMARVFPGELLVSNLSHRREDSCLALTGTLPELDAWKQALPEPIKRYVDMWVPLMEYKSSSLLSSH
ncbi:hypothetical protein H6P81_009739 [Aristolochia fimbriata]|uniref:S-adenosyl-L-methionine-dependent methyltransferases superfamily protein n=1 Tax=Aristolochia fimbriata TaxID=158543 RepID=A0AAV7EMM8_ARIFI|nr:hypothetical protein H6P81_009739 [Aristolochia fimbriata]